MKNVALFGNMYAGKSTLAAALVDAGYVKLSFAGPLKNIAAMAYGEIDKTQDYETTSVDYPIATTEKYKIVHKSGRQLLQEIGQTIKEVDKDFWLKVFFRDAKNYGDMPLTVDDGRFMFEFEALKEQGWLTVGIMVPETIRDMRAVTINGRPPTPEERNHASEIEVPDIIAKCDIVVDGTVEAYYNAKRILHAARDNNNDD